MYNIYYYQNYDIYITSDLFNFLTENGFKINKLDKSNFLPNFPNIKNVIKRVVIVENVDNKDFFIIDHIDNCDINNIKPLLSLPNCKFVIKYQYKDGEYGEYSNKIFPYVYMERNPILYKKIINNISINSNIPLMFFKGNKIYGREYILERLEKLKVLNSNYLERSNEQDYFKEMSNYKIAISLPGNGNFCHREFECFGLGIPVLMPKHKNRLYHSLIPNYHYIDPDIKDNDSLDDKVIKIYSKFSNKVKDNDFLNFIAANAKEYYNNYVKYDNNIKLMLNIIREKNGTEFFYRL